MRTVSFISCALVLVVAACAAEPPSGGEPAVVNDERFHPALLAAVASYADDYGNVDDALRWAPALCRAPPAAARLRESASADAGTHGRKLYWLYAKDREAYLRSATGAAQPVGQVLVKEAFVAEPGRGDAEQDGAGLLVPVVERDGEPYHAGARQALYVLMKLAPETEGTDEGWVYATLTPDGLTVTSAGRVAACINCHTRDTTDRMVGLPAR